MRTHTHKKVRIVVVLFLFLWESMEYVRDYVVVAVIFDYPLGSFHDITRVDGVDPFRSRTSREHRKYTGPTADVEDDGVVEHGRCPEDERCVSRGAHFVSEHCGVNLCDPTVSHPKEEVRR